MDIPSVYRAPAQVHLLLLDLYAICVGPLLKSICQQISYFYMLPFEDIPDDTVPVTAFLKVRIQYYLKLG